MRVNHLCRMGIFASIILSASPTYAQSSSAVAAYSFSSANLPPYQVDVRRRIRRAWFPPKGNESKVVTVEFFLHKDGSVTDLHLAKSSGVLIADKAAVKAVENAEPFRPLPEGANEGIQQLTFDYQPVRGL